MPHLPDLAHGYSVQSIVISIRALWIVKKKATAHARGVLGTGKVLDSGEKFFEAELWEYSIFFLLGVIHQGVIVPGDESLAVHSLSRSIQQGS